MCPLGALTITRAVSSKGAIGHTLLTATALGGVVQAADLDFPRLAIVF